MVSALFTVNFLLPASRRLHSKYHSSAQAKLDQINFTRKHSKIVQSTPGDFEVCLEMN
jgi:hypothetical protein